MTNQKLTNNISFENISTDFETKTLCTHETIVSINTDYTAITKNLLVKHTKHSKQRACERIIDDNMIRKCLKYGRKDVQRDGKVRF